MISRERGEPAANRKFQFVRMKSSGQATVELLIVLIILFGMLAISIRLFADQRGSVNQQMIQNGAARSGQLIAQTITAAFNGPIGSTFRVFIPPGPASQTIRIRSGFVEVQSAGELALVSIPDANVDAGSFTDATTIQVTHTLSGVQVSG